MDEEMEGTYAELDSSVPRAQGHVCSAQYTGTG